MGKQAMTTMKDPINHQAQPDFMNSQNTKTELSNIVFREVRDFSARKLAIMVAKYNGSPEDAIEKAKVLSDKMFACFPSASNMQSRMGAFDENGFPKWTISPNLQNISEVGTPDAAFTWGFAA